MSETPQLRAISFESDIDGGRQVLDIVQYDAPSRIEGSRSFTALSKDATRRAVMVALAQEVDRLLNGEATEIHLVLMD